MSSAFINAHITRALLAGADASTIDRTWLDTVDAWLTPADDLLGWIDPAFGVIKDGSNVISRMFDLGTTRLPRGGDFTPTTTTTTYSATAFNSSTIPGWVNANTTSYGIFGNYGLGTSVLGRANPIRRKPGVTMVAAYSKAHTNKVTPIAIGEFRGMSLSHTSGSPGSASFNVFGIGWSANSTSAFSGSGTRVIGGTNDGTTSTVYIDGVAGTGATGISTNEAIYGVTDESAVYMMGSGSSQFKGTQNTKAPGGGYSFGVSEAQFTGACIMFFGTAFSASRMASLHTLIRNRVGA